MAADKSELAALSLVNEIKQCHKECLKQMDASVVWGIKCGGLLCKFKDQAGHGNFGGMVERYFDFSHQTANVYMRLHKDLGHLSNSQRARILEEANSIRGVQKLLAGPKESPPSPRPKPDQPEVIDAAPVPPSNQTTHVDADTWDDPLETPEPPEFQPEKPKSNGTPPRQLDRPAYYKQWDQAIGPLVRLVDKIAAGVGESGSHEHKLVQDRLNLATETMIEWMGVDQ